MLIRKLLVAAQFAVLAIGCSQQVATDEPDEFDVAVGELCSSGPSVSPHYVRMDVGEVKLNVRIEGRSGAPLVMLHGFPESADDWAAVNKPLASGHAIFSPDLRGYNDSDKPALVSDYEMPRIVSDVRALVARVVKLTHEKPVVVAHDWGTVPAYLLASQHPELVAGLVIINGIHPDVARRELSANPAQRQALSYVNLFTSPAAETVLGGSNYQPLINVFVDDEGRQLLSPEEQERHRRSYAKPGALTGMLDWYRANLSPDPTLTIGPTLGPEVPQNVVVEVPTRILWGMKDKAFLPGLLDNLDEWIPNASVKRFANANHWILHEEPAALADEIDAVARAR